MPIVSASQEDKEAKVIQVALDAVAKTTQKLEEKIEISTSTREAKRKKTAKRVAILTTVSALFSCIIFMQVDNMSGLLCAIMTSMLPTVVNLVDD